MPNKRNAAAKARRADFAFYESLRVRYVEVDAQNIVFNAHYLMYFDVGVTEYIRARTGKSYGALVAEHGVDFHVQQSLIDYRAPARFDDMLDIGVRGGYRGARILWEIAIFRGEELLCSGRLTYATVDAAKGGIRRISAELAASLGFSPIADDE